MSARKEQETEKTDDTEQIDTEITSNLTMLEQEDVENPDPICAIAPTQPNSNITDRISNKLDRLSIKAPTSNSHTSLDPPSVKLTPNETEDRLVNALETHGGFTSKSHTMRSLQYLHALRVKDNLFPARSATEVAISPSKSHLTNPTPHAVDPLQLDDIEDEEQIINDAISNWTLKFESTIREKQFRIFVTERYGTSIRVSILAMIVAYIFLAGTNGSFVKGELRVIFVCLGLLTMLIIFCVASSFSSSSSSSTTSYIKALLGADQGSIHKDEIPNTNPNASRSILIRNTAVYARTLFALYSNHMTALCVMCLLLLLILQNTIGGGSLLDNQFLVYYVLSLLVTSTYGSIGYEIFMICTWMLWIVWNVLAVIATQMELREESFDFWNVNVTLIIGQLVIGHQVKQKDLERRKAYLRAMNYVHNMHSEVHSKDRTVTPRTYNTKTPRRHQSIYDITSDPTLRDKLSAAVLESVLDKALVSGRGSTHDERDSPGFTAFASAGSVYHSPLKAPNKSHTRHKSKLFADMRKELTHRSTGHGRNSSGAAHLGVELGIINTQRESRTLGIWGMIRGFGSNLSHLETHEEEDEQDAFPQRLSGLSHPDGNDEQRESANNARILKTVISQQILAEQEEKGIQKIQDMDVDLHQQMQAMLEDTMRNTEPHCGSFHELPKWYKKTIESYVLCGYRLNYTGHLCAKSMFQKHNETMNIWTEFIPAVTLTILIIYFNVNVDDFWALSDVHGAMTKNILYISMPFIIIRPIISGLAHTFSCISKKSSRIWWQLDFLSIIFAAGFGSLIWIHCIFYCYPHLQYLYIFALFALAFSTTITALTTTSVVIRDLSLGAFFTFTLIFLYFYELYVFILSNFDNNFPNSSMVYWTLSILCIVCAVIFRASKLPEAFLIKRRFRKLMEKEFLKTFSEAVESEAGVEKVASIKEKQASFKQQMTFARMLQDIQSFTIKTENKLANIENMESHLYDNVNTEELNARKEKLEHEIENLENEIVNEIKNEITVEHCMESAYIDLISDNQNVKQWFNYIFTSHNFWHIFMNLAVMFGVVSWKHYFKWRAKQENICVL